MRETEFRRYTLDSPVGDSRVFAYLYDVDWDGDGFGKHGRGPYLTSRQAHSCLNALPWSGRVVGSLWEVDASYLLRLVERLERLQRRASYARSY